MGFKKSYSIQLKSEMVSPECSIWSKDSPLDSRTI